MIWRGVCALCGGPVTGGSDDGTLDLPVGGEAVVCLACLCFGEAVDWPRIRAEAEEAFGAAGIPYLVKKELAEA